MSPKTSNGVRRAVRMVLHAFALAVLLSGEVSMAQSFDAGLRVVNFNDRRAVALAKISNIATSPTDEQEAAARGRIAAVNRGFADQFDNGIEKVSETFEKNLWFYQSFSESRVRETLEESYNSTDFSSIEEGYEIELIDYISRSVAEIFLDGKVRIDRILFDEYISMLPGEARATAKSEFARLISIHPNLPSTAPRAEKPETDLSTLQATIAAVVARRLAASRIGQRLLSGLGKRLFNNAVGRGAIAVLAPGGEICGPAIILCETGLFTIVVGWEGVRNRARVVEAVDAALTQQGNDLRTEVLGPEAIDEIWSVIEVEASSLLGDYRDVVEQVMRDTFDDVVRQNADFIAGDLPQGMGAETRAHVFRQMASTFGDGFLEFQWADRYAYMNAMGDRARELLDSHGSPLLNLYLSRPEMLVRVLRAGASDSLTSQILRSEDPSFAISSIGEAIRQTGRLTDDVDAALVDLLRFELPVLPEEIDPQGIRIAASTASRLRMMVDENSSKGAVLYAQVLRGTVSAKALDYVLLSSDPSRMVEVFVGLPASTVSRLIRSEDVGQLSSFIASFPIQEAVRLLSSSESDTYTTIFSHRSGGADGVRAWDELMGDYARPPLPWMQEQFLWIVDLGYEPSSVSMQMINTAYDSSGQPDFLRRFWTWWAFVTGWPWGSFFLIIIVAFLAARFAPKLFRSFKQKDVSTRTLEQKESRVGYGLKGTGEGPAERGSERQEYHSRNAGSSSDVQAEGNSANEEDKQSDPDHHERPTGAT